MYNECMARRTASKKGTRNLIITLIVIVLIAAIVAVVIYFAAPELFDELLGKIDPSGDDGKTPPTVLAPGEGELQVHFMDVGQGDSILILFPDGKDMLIDCANYNNSSSYRTETLAYMDNYITDGQLDYLMLTHCDSDHVYFMDEVLEKYQVDNVFMPNVLATHDKVAEADLPQEQLDRFTDEDTISTACYADFFIAALTEPDCEIVLNVDPDEDTNSIVITDGTEQSDGSYDGATYMLTFYCPTEEYYESTGFDDANGYSAAEYKNAVSPIGILEYNDVRIVLTGDSNEINEPIVAERLGNIDCDVLKVAHHGSESSSLDVFLDAVDCEFAVISCGEGNNHDHPRQEALDRLIEDDMTIYRTDNNGNIVLTVDETGEMKFTLEREVDQSVNRDGWTDEEIAAKG